MPPRIHPTLTQAQRAEQSSVSLSSLRKSALAVRDGIPEIAQALRDGKISTHRAFRISRLSDADQLAVLQGKKHLRKETPPKVIGYIAGFDDAREAAAELAKAAGYRALAARIRSLRPKG